MLAPRGPNHRHAAPQHPYEPVPPEVPVSLFSSLMGRKSKPAAPEPQVQPWTDIDVKVMATPNPDARMFKSPETLVPSGTYEYTSVEAAGASPLAQKLLAVDGVELVLIAPRFVTVRKSSNRDWAELEGGLRAKLQESLYYGEMAVLDDAIHSTPQQRTAIEQKILQLLDEEIRPAIAQDGGDCTFEGFEDGVVKLRLIGACGTCPSSVTTLKMGIERLMVEEIPEVREVVSV